jgi:hypothetical protein
MARNLEGQMIRKNNKRYKKGDLLRGFLYRKAKALSDEALETDGQVPSEKIKALERLVRVKRIRDTTKTPSRWRRWRAGLALLITLAIVSVLLYVRVPRTEIEVNLTLTELTFVLSKQVMLVDTMVLSALGVSELREIQLPRPSGSTGQVTQSFRSSEDNGYAVRISAITSEESEGTITLTSLVMPAGTRVWLCRTNVPLQYCMSIEAPAEEELNLQVSVKGKVRAVVSRKPVKELKYLSPKTIRMKAASNQVNLDLTLHSESEAAFKSQIYAKDLSFIGNDPLTETMDMSALLSGTLYLADLNYKEYMLRTGERLHFEQSEGMIRALRLGNDNITVEFNGKVCGMTTGWEDKPKTLMPAWLERLRAHNSLVLLWVSTAYLFTLAIKVLKWWRE